MKKALMTAFSTAAIFLGTVSPTFAATTIQISGNGAGSNNQIVVNNTNTRTVSQNNIASISNSVNSNTNTGSNTSNGNTRGSVVVRTGNTSNQTTISNRANINIANIVGCVCSGNCN